MTGDLARTVAFAFRRKAASTLTRSELMLTLAMDLRWLSPDEAKRTIDAAQRSGLLSLEGDALKLTFPPESVQVPLNYRPPEGVWEEVSDFPTLPPPAAAPADHEAEAERARRGGMVSIEVARVLVARRKGEDVAARAAEIETRLLRG